ncbi:MAG: C-GCAxxG-C-C family protein [Sphaerochaeta sp.]|nr:C-GCAxxG-C-C family protein [Sphaerochaeta sp.]
MNPSYKERARRLREQGYNCAQAVACAFSPCLAIDEETLFKIMEGFGGGMGGHQATCGALSGAIAIIGLLNSNGVPDARIKAETYALASRAVESFEATCKSLVCKEILGDETGVVLYSCEACVAHGVELVETLMDVP